jgi:hypothetical protein
MKYILIIIALFQLSACFKSSTPVHVPQVEETASSSVSIPHVEVEVGAAIKLIPVEYYSTAEERKTITQVEHKLNAVTSSKCLHDFIAARKMIQTQNKTSKEVADDIASLSGSVSVVMYYSRFSSAMAYRQPPELKINLNRKFFNASTPICEWVSTVLHESLHALKNYEHDFKWNAQRDYSVNYSANFAVDACCK